MPVIFGIILGAILTIAGAYVFDSAGGRITNGLPPTAAGGHPPLVNWDVVSDDWNSLQDSVRDTAQNLERSLKRHTG